MNIELHLILSNTAVRLQFEDLAVTNYLFLKDVLSTLINVKFFFLNILTTKCYSVRERAFFTLGSVRRNDDDWRNRRC